MHQQTDPQKPPYFYLSYAQAEDKSKVEQFFNDLSDSVRIRAGLPLDETVGCCENCGDREAGLRTSRVMIALLSLPYFKDKTAGREWQIFEMRKALTEANDTQVIIPLRWLSYSGATPVVINQTPIFNVNGHEPVANMLHSPAKQRDYAEFVNNLANYIVDVTALFHLPGIDSIPDDISNAFENVDEPTTDSEPTNSMPKILNQNLLIIDGAFAKSVAEQIKETTTASAPVSVPSSGQTAQSTRVTPEKYKVFTVDKKREDMQKIERTALISPDFDVKPYTDPGEFLDDITELVNDRKEPDLIVVNPALIDPRTHNYSLIETLLDEKVHSAILATSKDSDAVSRLKGRGLNDLVTLLPETLTSKELIQRMRHWAKLGRDKRYGRGRSDERPVFLSFTGADKEMANKICKWLELREIGVWYSFETLKPGDLWIEKIKQGLANAEVFIALISNDYPLSDYCQAELGYILDRVETESRDLPVIPVHYRSPTLALEDRQIKTLKRQAVPISDQEWLLGCQQILETVQNFLKRREN